MKKRNLMIVAMLLIASCFVFASGGKETAVSQPTELKGNLMIWSTLTQTERATELENLARKFEQDNPGVTVEIAVMPWAGVLDKLMAAIMAGNPPDLTVVGQGTPQTLSASGGLEELSDVIEKIGGKDQFIGTSLSVLGSSTDGGAYAVPLYITPVVAYYRDSYIKEAGITELPTTWEGYYEMCKAVTDPSKNRYGFGIPLGDHHGTKTIWSFLQGNGVNLVNVDKDGNWYVDIDEKDRQSMIEVYEYLYKLVKDCSPEGALSYTQANVRELVAKGIIMSRIDTPEIYYNVRKMDPENISDVRYIQIPPNKSNGQYMGWAGFSIPSAGNVSLAKAFLEYAYTDNRLLDFYLSYPHAMFPAQESVFHSDEYQSGLPAELQPMVPNLALDILSQSSSIALAAGPFPYAGEVEQKNMLGLPFSQMFTAGISAEEAVNRVIKELKSLFD